MGLIKFMIAWALVMLVSFSIYGCGSDYGGISNTGSGSICIVPTDAGEDVKSSTIDCGVDNSNNSDNSVSEAPAEDPEE